MTLKFFFCLQQQDSYERGDVEENNIYENQWPSPTNWGPQREYQPPPPPPVYNVNTYGLSRRPDLTTGPSPSPPQRQAQNYGQNFAIYDPVTRQRTTAFDRNCTAPGCCVPKCFAQKGSRVR